MKQLLQKLSILLIVFSICSCLKAQKKWAGQAPIKIVPTTTLPIQKQYVGTFDLGNGVYATNNFTGARLNGITLTDDTLITALITPENTPINPSPWYAFKLWANEKKEMTLKITYLDGAFHRYYPKVSHDGLNWTLVDSAVYRPGESYTAPNGRELSRNASMDLTIGPDTLWVSAQELKTSIQVTSWMNKLSKLPYVSHQEIGKSREGRPMNLLKVGKSDDKKMIFVLSRQHPPEVTGYLAMEAFVEMIASDHKLAVKFRKKFNTYVVPLANPDGVDHGHWRHSTGGIDLNRDWKNVNQPEIAAIQKFMTEKVKSSGGKFYFGVDFHSTWEDIYYTISPEFKGNMPGLVPNMIQAMAEKLALDPNIRPGPSTESKVTSSQYFFHEFGAESLTYEIGDNTPRDLLRKKGEASALELMRLLLEKK